MRRRLRRYHLRHKIHAIKTRPNNPLRFLQRKNSIRRYLANDLTCAARKTTFRTRKRFHNKQYTPKSKVQPLEPDRTHFDIGFNNGNYAMHRQTLIFLLSHKITTVQQKTTNRNNQSQKHTQNKNNKQLRKNVMFLNIIISPTATTSEPTAYTLFIKTQYNRKKQNNILHFEVTILQPRKSKTLYF